MLEQGCCSTPDFGLATQISVGQNFVTVMNYHHRRHHHFIITSYYIILLSAVIERNAPQLSLGLYSHTLKSFARVRKWGF